MNSEVEQPFDGHAPSAWRVIAWIAGGFLLGVGIGAFVGDVTYKPDPYSLLDFGRGFNVIFGALVGAPIGLLLGALLFAFWRAHRTWQRRFDAELQSETRRELRS